MILQKKNIISTLLFQQILKKTVLSCETPGWREAMKKKQCDSCSFHLSDKLMYF